MIGFDLDGVIADSENIFKRIFLEEFDFDITANNREFNFVVPDVPQETIYDAVDWCINQVHEITTCNGALEALVHIQGVTGKPIQIVTARPMLNSFATFRWMKEHLIPKNITANVHFVKSADKANFLQQRGFTAFVEDRFRTANQVADVLPLSYLVNRAYNTGREAHEKVIRVNDLNGVVEHYLRER